MKKFLNLKKERLFKRMRYKIDDDELILMRIYNDQLNIQNYVIDAIINKKMQADFPGIENIKYLYDSKTKKILKTY